MKVMHILLMSLFCFGGGCFAHFLFGTPLDQFEQSYTKRWGRCEYMEKGQMFQYYEWWRKINTHKGEIEQFNQALAVADTWLLMGPEEWANRAKWSPEEAFAMEMFSNFQFLSRLVELESEQSKLRLRLWMNAREIYYHVAQQMEAHGIREEEWNQIAEQLKRLETLEERKSYLRSILKSKCKDATVLSSGKPYCEEA